MMTEARTFEALLRNEFRVFVHNVFPTLSPGRTYVPTWHVEAVAWRLERVRRGEIRRLMINMPPRSLKSIAATNGMLSAFQRLLTVTRRSLSRRNEPIAANQAKHWRPSASRLTYWTR